MLKKDMCISCGNCSTYCEMGIDVRQYAMANQSFTRASCVGCGMCARLPAGGAQAREQADPLEGRPADPHLRSRPVKVGAPGGDPQFADA